MRRLSIGQVAKEAELSVKTIRFYERIGLIPPPQRDISSGYRRYTEADIKRLSLIRSAKLLGLRLSQIKQMAEVLKDDGCNCTRLKPHLASLVNEQLKEIATRLEELTALKEELQKIQKRSGKAPLPRGFCTCSESEQP